MRYGDRKVELCCMNCESAPLLSRRTVGDDAASMMLLTTLKEYVFTILYFLFLLLLNYVSRITDTDTDTAFFSAASALEVAYVLVNERLFRLGANPIDFQSHSSGRLCVVLQALFQLAAPTISAALKEERPRSTRLNPIRSSPTSPMGQGEERRGSEER